MDYTYEYMAYVAEDGNYGVDYTVTFDIDKFNALYPNAWDIIGDIHDSQKTEFILAVLGQDEETLRALAEDYDFSILDVLD